MVRTPIRSTSSTVALARIPPPRWTRTPPPPPCLGNSSSVRCWRSPMSRLLRARSWSCRDCAAGGTPSAPRPSGRRTAPWCRGSASWPGCCRETEQEWVRAHRRKPKIKLLLLLRKETIIDICAVHGLQQNLQSFNQPASCRSSWASPSPSSSSSSWPWSPSACDARCTGTGGRG